VEILISKSLDETADANDTPALSPGVVAKLPF